MKKGERNLNKTKVFFILFLSLSIVMNTNLIWTCTATSTIHYVNDDGGAEYTSIQEAINAAESGDTVVVSSGIYYENIVGKFFVQQLLWREKS